MKITFAALLVALVVSLPTMFVNAGEKVLSNNNGDSSTTWFITGEQTLVMNGFDLTPLGLNFPATIDKASITVDTPVAGTPVDVIIYQDANGGSPIDATLAGQTQATINQAGVFTVTFPTPITITQPVVWVGFYLPVNFKFLSDKSGTSVLTYWAWTSNSRFDLSKLNTAQVLGPSNGTAPVSIDLKGIARISAEISSASGAAIPTTIPVNTISGTPIAGSVQLPAPADVDASPLRGYPPACDTLYWDTEDVGISYGGKIEPRCTAIWNGYAPPAPTGYKTKQLYYDITFYDDKGQPITTPLPIPVTHCIQTHPDDINTAIIGISSGSPRSFKILPTMRVGNRICAEIDRSGGISYMVPG
ncbi:MAG: hypothetical protein R3E39_07185 [Anaerolineae bacterium]